MQGGTFGYVSEMLLRRANLEIFLGRFMGGC